MSKFFDKFTEEELISIEQILDKEFDEAKSSLPIEEFKKLYVLELPEYENDATKYYKRTYNDIKEDELEPYLLYEILKEKRKTRKSINAIKGILIAYALLTVAGIVFLVLQFV